MAKVSDLCWCGFVDEFDDSYDKVSIRTSKILKRFENKRFYSVTTTEDPILDKYVLENEGNVFATDAVLAVLMASPRSVYSWDIVIEKANGMLFLGMLYFLFLQVVSLLSKTFPFSSLTTTDCFIPF